MTVLAFRPHDCQAKSRRDKCSCDSTPAPAASMAQCSPSRRAQSASTPDRAIRSSFLLDNRNTETSHLGALTAAQVEHDRVRQAAIRVYELHELKEERQRILDEERKERERLKAEAEIAVEETRLQELRAKSIPKPPPPAAPQPPEPLEQPPSEAPAYKTTPAAKKLSGLAPANIVTNAEPSNASSSSNPSTPLQKNGLFTRPMASSPLNPQGQQLFSLRETEAGKLNDTFSARIARPGPPAAQAPAMTQIAASKPADDRLVQIHRELKTLRKELMALSKAPGSPLKGKVGALRREIRVAIGQLTGEKGANVQPTNRIMAILKEALGGRMASPLVDVGRFLVETRPAGEAGNTESGLPSLFVYLINICAKGIISQFINECGANPKAANPIGVFTAQLFSHKDFQWQGHTLMDILLAKFRVVCPVLFGFRGNDKTEKGRQSIGWRKDGPSWITEQSHNDRMAGLGAGFAAVSLRDFTKSSKVNPYPPTHYWKAFAGIVNSPPNETSNTHYFVLRSMIEGHEQRFLDFYGNAAVAALRLALVEFPKKAPEQASAAGTLRALAEVLRTEGGLTLA